MNTAEFDVSDFEPQNNDKGVHGRFYIYPIQNERLSAEAGRPIFEDVEFVEILAPGNSTNIVRRPAREMDKRRFARAYAAFKSGVEDSQGGTPLSEIPWLTRSQVEELNYIRVRTVEQLADLNDAACVNSPGMFGLKKKAQAWIERSAEAAPFTKLAAENEDLRARLAALEAQMAQPAPTGKK